MKRYILRFFQKTSFINMCIGVGLFCLGGVVIPFVYARIYTTTGTSSADTGSTPTRLAQNQYSLINPLLLCSTEQNTSSIDFSLQKKISSFIQDRISKGDMTDMSVYIQEYGLGKWLGVNENTRYDPASLLKVPLMIAYYQLSEKDPGILSRQTSFTGTDQNIGEYFRSPYDIVPGKMYSIDQLITSMIVNSDNTAVTLLSNYVSKSSLIDVYTDLGLPIPSDDPSPQYISAKSYAYFFRILYNATYLNRADSEKALTLLSQSHLPNGIASAVPEATTVADKFGERTAYDASGAVLYRELHDCGIVYKANSPYLLCIMSKGNDFNQLAQNIHDLSALVYTNVTKR